VFPVDVGPGTLTHDSLRLRASAGDGRAREREAIYLFTITTRFFNERAERSDELSRPANEQRRRAYHGNRFSATRSAGAGERSLKHGRETLSGQPELIDDRRFDIALIRGTEPLVEIRHATADAIVFST
jgi:hypothetical protein